MPICVCVYLCVYTRMCAHWAGHGVCTPCSIIAAWYFCIPMCGCVYLCICTHMCNCELAKVTPCAIAAWWFCRHTYLCLGVFVWVCAHMNNHTHTPTKPLCTYYPTHPFLFLSLSHTLSLHFSSFSSLLLSLSRTGKISSRAGADEWITNSRRWIEKCSQRVWCYRQVILELSLRKNQFFPLRFFTKFLHFIKYAVCNWLEIFTLVQHTIITKIFWKRGEYCRGKGITVWW